MPSSKSCSKSVTEFSALNLISASLGLFIFKQPKGIPVPVKIGFTVPTVLSLWEDLEDLPRSPSIYFEEQGFNHLQNFKVHDFHSLLDTTKSFENEQAQGTHSAKNLPYLLWPGYPLKAIRSPHKSLFLGIL